MTPQGRRGNEIRFWPSSPPPSHQKEATCYLRGERRREEERKREVRQGGAGHTCPVATSQHTTHSKGPQPAAIKTVTGAPQEESSEKKEQRTKEETKKGDRRKKKRGKRKAGIGPHVPASHDLWRPLRHGPWPENTQTRGTCIMAANVRAPRTNIRTNTRRKKNQKSETISSFGQKQSKYYAT